MRAAPGRCGRWLATAGLIALALGATVACDSTATLYTSEVKWDQLVVMSAVPMAKTTADGGATVYEPMCRSTEASPDGLLFNVLFQGSVKKEDEVDNDLSIKPGDRVDLKTIEEDRVVPGLFDMGISCIEPSPDESLASCSTNLKADSLTVNDVSFYNYLKGSGANPRGKVALAVVVDMSGSMTGLVHPFPPYFEDTKTNVSNAFPIGFVFRNNATDPGNARLNAVVELIKSMNPEDAVIVFAFNEGKVDVVCEIASSPDASYEEKKAECFTTNRKMVLGPDLETGFGGALMKLTGLAEGRTPLWYTIREVYEYMQTNDVSKDADYRHILVITDGPDTCAASSDLNLCTGPCVQYNTDYETVYSLIEGDDPEDRVPVHFVQMGAKGYTDRDPRQMEVACLTGGQYMFVNANQVAGADLGNLLIATLKAVRYTFRGYWRFAIQMSTLGKNNEPPVGYNYLMAGDGKVLPGEEGLLVSVERGFQFAVGGGAAEVANGDHRVSIRKECTPGKDDEDCAPGETGPAKACVAMNYWCDEQTFTCRSGEVWDADGEASSCGDVNAKIKLSKGTNDQNRETIDLGKVPTLCCAGQCLPPAPPVPPSDQVPTAVFSYEKDGAWYREDPTDPDSDWVVDATFRAGDGSVSLDTVKGFLKYDDTGALAWPGDWNCPAEDSQNCFLPPGSEE